MGFVTHESEVNSALNCRPRFIVIRKADRDDAVLREVALFVDVTLDNKIGGVLQKVERKGDATKTTVGWR